MISFDEICKKGKEKIKLKKMNDTFLDNIPWLKSNQPPLIYLYIIYLILKSWYEKDKVAFLGLRKM